MISDDLNQDFLLNGISTELIVKIAKGDIDVKDLALKQLRDRGLDINGKWVGFKK